MSQKLVVASVPISITVFSLGSIIIRKTGLRIDCRVVYIIFLSYLFLFFSCFTIQSKRFLFSQTQSWIVLMKYDDIVVNVLPAPFPGFFEVRVFVQMAYLNVFLSCRFNMQKKNKNVTFLKFFSIFFLPPPGVVSEDFFLIQLICRKKIKKEIFLQVFFSIFAGHFLPLFVHLSKQQKKQNLIWILLYKEFFLFQQSHKTSFWKTNTQLFLRDIFLLHYKHQIHSIQKYLHCH